MAVKASGQLSFTEIRAEYPGEAAPYNLSEYYRGGSFVPASVTDIPASGQIRFSDFFGTSNVFATQTGLTNGDFYIETSDESLSGPLCYALVFFKVVDDGTDMIIKGYGNGGTSDTFENGYFDKAAGGTQAVSGFLTEYELYRLNNASGYYVKAEGSLNSAINSYSIINNVGTSFTTTDATGLTTVVQASANAPQGSQEFGEVDYRWTFSFSANGSTTDFTFSMDGVAYAFSESLY